MFKVNENNLISDKSKKLCIKKTICHEERSVLMVDSIGIDMNLVGALKCQRLY